MSSAVRYQVMPPLSSEEVRKEIKSLESLSGFKALDDSEIDWLFAHKDDLSVTKSAIVNAMWRNAHPEWRKPQSVGHVYFIEAPSAGVVKIGYASAPSERIKSIQGMSPIPLRMVATMPGAIADERNLHKKFSHLRSHGEWFHFTSEIADFIGGIK